MSTNSKGIRYDEDFKRTLVNLYQSGGKTQTALCKEYGVSQSCSHSLDQTIRNC